MELLRLDAILFDETCYDFKDIEEVEVLGRDVD